MTQQSVDATLLQAYSNNKWMLPMQAYSNNQWMLPMQAYSNNQGIDTFLDKLMQTYPLSVSKLRSAFAAMVKCRLKTFDFCDEI